MYELLTGPVLIASLALSFMGVLYNVIVLWKEARRDQVVLPYLSLRYGLRSIIHWVIPFASRNMRLHPEVTIVSFVFHLGIWITPIFLLAHNVMVERAIGIRLPTLSEGQADLLTILVIFCGGFLFCRRLLVEEVRYVSEVSDHLLLILVILPFLTGFFAHRQWLNYQLMLNLHVLSGEVLLAVIPISRIRHMLFFPFTRAYMGSEFGAVRNSRDW